MIKKIKEIALPTWCQIALVGALISAGGLLFAQTQKQIDKKANKETVAQMLEVVRITQQMQDRDIKEQKENSKMLNHNIQKLTEQMIILNEQLKKE